MINKFGKNLNILIVTEVGQDWRAYATWYSAFHNVPDAQIGVACFRNENTPFQLFQWTKRLRVPKFFVNPLGLFPTAEFLNCAKLAQKPNLLVIDDRTLFLDVLDPKLLDVLNTKEVCLDPNYNVQFLRNQNADDLLNQILLEDRVPYTQPLCFEANETESLTCLVSCRKGCGKWIDTSKGCPFSNAAGLASTEMTANENRIIELWKRMCSMYSAVA